MSCSVITSSAMRTILISALALACAMGAAQRGTAPAGYYPLGYSGDTYTGTVTGTEDSKITLEYRNKSKTETFVAVITEPCVAPTKTKPVAVKELHLTTVPTGSNITVFYRRTKVKSADRSKEDANVMIGFWFNELNGEKLSNPPLIPCFTGMATFKYF